MKSKLIEIFKGISFFLFSFALLYGLSKYHDKEFRERTYKINFKGRVSASYKDKNDHNRDKIEILNNSKTIVYDLTNDGSGLFEYVNVGDSIEKYPNSIDVRVYGLSKDTIFKLDF